jgi:K+-sensing histidine kinase KdpD
MRRFADTRSAALPWRLCCGASTVALGLIVVLALDDLLDDALVLAAFFPAVQIAALLGGLAAAACSALLSALIVHFWIMPFPELWLGFLLFFVSAALAGVAVRAARVARRERAAAGSATVSAGPIFEAVAATIAHDLNQPLAAAVAYLQSARRLIAAESAEGRASSVVETLDKAAAQLTRAGRLVAGLRDFLAHGPSRLAPVDLHALIRETVGACESAPALRLDARSAVVLADRAQIEQLLEAVLAHAPLAPPARAATVVTASDSALATIEIDFPARPAAQAGESESWACELSIWRAIVEAHRGAFRIAATAEGGSMIAFSLPLATPANAIGG